MKTPRITQSKDAYVFDYPQAKEFAVKQMDTFWHPNEVDVSKDVHQMRTDMTEAEYHGICTVLRLFAKYETIVGNEYWGGKIKRAFPNASVELMATTFAFMEIGVHAVFYNRLNEALMIADEDFHNSWKEDETLAERIDFINAVADREDDLPLSLAAFVMLEGAVLYSSFAFLKSFSSAGRNKLVNVNAGISFSVSDEMLHAEAGAWLFKTLVEESELTFDEHLTLGSKIEEVAYRIVEHEDRIVDMIFEKGEIENVTPETLKAFVRSRVNMCLRMMDQKEIFILDENPIAEWFYGTATGYSMVDTFFKVSSEYERVASEADFSW